MIGDLDPTIPRFSSPEALAGGASLCIETIMVEKTPKGLVIEVRGNNGIVFHRIGPVELTSHQTLLLNFPKAV